MLVLLIHCGKIKTIALPSDVAVLKVFTFFKLTFWLPCSARLRLKKAQTAVHS
jgi:hypothetical protein